MSYKLALEPKINDKGQIESELSTYQPSGRAKKRLAEVRDLFTIADQVRDFPYREFGYLPLEQKINNLQDRFMNFITPVDASDPSVSWRANTIRPLTRNKVLEVAAYITANIMYPRVVAQNDKDEQDKKFSQVMEDCMQWANEQSGYDIAILQAVVSMLVFPGAVMYEGYVDYERDFKVIKPDGTWDFKKMVDAVYSGFQCEVIPLDEIYFGDAYAGKNVQKQPFIIRRRILNYESAKIMYWDNEDFKKFVKPGIRIFQDSSNTYYAQQEESFNANQVEEITVYSRLSDLEIRIVNGVLMDDPDRPLQREDKLYPFAISGYGLYDSGQFVYWKSMVDDMVPDQDQADMLINYILDGTYLQMMPPSVLYGDDIIDRGVMIPGSISTLSQGSKMDVLAPQGNIGLGLNVLQNLEVNASASSKQEITQKDMTAYQTSRIEEEIKVKLGLFGKFLAHLVEQFGNLRLPTIVEHITTPQLPKISTTDGSLEFLKINVSKKSENGYEDRQIEISDEVPYGDLEEMQVPDGETIEDKLLEQSIKLLSEETKTGKKITRVNPEALKDLKYYCKINVDTLFRRSEEAERAYVLEYYDRAMMHPNSKKIPLLNLLTEQYKPGQSDKFIEENPPMPMGMPVPEETGGGKQIKELAMPNTPPKP